MLLGGYPPFAGKSSQQTIAKIRRHEIKWYKNRWDKVSKAAKDLVLGLLRVDSKKRLTALAALEHPWIKNLGYDEDASMNRGLDEDALKALRGFVTKSNFEKAASMLMVQCLPSDEVARLEKLFLSLDRTHEGSVVFGDLKAALQSAEVFDVEQLFHELDYNHDEHVYFSDFLTAIISAKMNSRSDALLKSAFDRFDTDSSGQISLMNLREIFGDTFRGESVEDLLDEADYDGDGCIDFWEFKKFLQEGRSRSGKKRSTTTLRVHREGVGSISGESSRGGVKSIPLSSEGNPEGLKGKSLSPLRNRASTEEFASGELCMEMTNLSSRGLIIGPEVEEMLGTERIAKRASERRRSRRMS